MELLALSGILFATFAGAALFTQTGEES